MPDPNQPTDQNSIPAGPPPAADNIPQSTTDVPPTLPPMESTDLPPFPPQEGPPAPQAAPEPPAGGSAAPPFDIPPVISPPPKKKFGGGKAIATILGLLLLVGGIGAGVVLVQQRQLFQQKAKIIEGSCTTSSDCSPGYRCDRSICVSVGGNVTPLPTTPKPPAPPPQCTSDTSQGCYDLPCTSTGLTGGTGSCPGGQQKYCCKNYPSTCADGGKPGDCVNPTYAQSRGQSTQQKWIIQNGVCALIGALTCTGTGGTTPQCKDASQIKCDANGCTVGSNYLSTTPSCFVMKYHCNDVKASGVSCDQLTGATLEGTGASESFSASCGTEQIDINCGACNIVYPAAGQQYFTSKRYASACTTSTVTPGGPTAQCLNVKVYDTNWTQLSADQLKALKAGDKVRFTVSGSATSGNFDKAKFKINGTETPEVTAKKPSTEEFFYEFTVPDGVTAFTINASIHHITLGWSN